MASASLSASASAPPRRFIYNDHDMDQFLKSFCKKDLLQLTSAMGKSCSSATDFEYDPAHPLMELYPAMAALHGSLRQMQTWITDIPPDEHAKARFGNPAFKVWHARLLERSVSIAYVVLQVGKRYADAPHAAFDEATLQDASQQGYDAAATALSVNDIVDATDQALVQELSAYLQLAFGHPIRLDYGTGHESSFQVFLLSLCKLGCFGSTEKEPPSTKRMKATTLSLYSAYLAVCRQIQTDYMLEPAGSHGVWGLDDYHCLPFYFGACQLVAADADLELTPKSIHSDRVLRDEGDKYMYFGCIRYIKSLKKGAPFFESSPMLNDISALLSWSKVASGLLQLYEGEVLKKRVVVQHFVFGNVFSADWVPSVEEEAQAPKETFRSGRGSGNSLSPTEGQAPWANHHSRTTPSEFSPTKAPWAK
ncbi:hypothetical protein MPSEU_000106600 [Mayamaea pseudoterrestris]|nr:hypothetical protein MPSEU_000106600 [Mayamaea pseudoterrestris]